MVKRTIWLNTDAFGGHGNLVKELVQKAEKAETLSYFCLFSDSLFPFLPTRRTEKLLTWSNKLKKLYPQFVFELGHYSNKDACLNCETHSIEQYCYPCLKAKDLNPTRLSAGLQV